MRTHFDLDPKLIYLNSGTQSIAPKSVLEAVTRHQREYEQNPTEKLIEASSRIWKVHQDLGHFFKADPRDLFLRANVTLALNEFLLGAKLSAKSVGDELLTTELEYGAILNIAQVRCNRDELKLRKLALNPSEDLGAQIVQALRPETRILLLSHVTTGTGLVLPLATIAKETRRRGILLIVDGAHAAGALDLNFEELSDVDFYAANLHKWMMGPKGTAFAWVAKQHQEHLSPINAGWTTFESVEPFNEFAEGSRFAAKFLMIGCHDYAPYLALTETLRFWRTQSAEAIRAKIFELQCYLEEKLDKALGWQKLSPPFGALRGPLLSYALPPELEREGYPLARRIYRESGLQIATPRVLEKTRMRFSPHIYNTFAECDRAVEILKKL